MGALVQAQNATQGITLLASTQQNLRAGMHFLVRDITQAGAGMPQGGVTIPNNASSVSNLNRPGTIPRRYFPAPMPMLPPIVPGAALGQLATSVNPQHAGGADRLQHRHHQHHVCRQHAGGHPWQFVEFLSGDTDRAVHSGMRGCDDFDLGNSGDRLFHHAGNPGNGAARGRQRDHVYR